MNLLMKKGSRTEFIPDVFSFDTFFTVLFFGGVCSLLGLFFGLASFHKLSKIFISGFDLGKDYAPILLFIICICFNIFLFLRFNPNMNKFTVNEFGITVFYCGFNSFYKWDEIAEFVMHPRTTRRFPVCAFWYCDALGREKTRSLIFERYNGIAAQDLTNLLNGRLSKHRYLNCK
jgi:hypothetical protein